tara:strand:- start:218 stop:421 length:204 start_codon:yes stop_codon:yes gene_type:complete
MNSTILSRIFRDARRAGEKITISRLQLKARQAAKMAILRTTQRSQAIKDGRARAKAARGGAVKYVRT